MVFADDKGGIISGEGTITNESLSFDHVHYVEEFK